MTHHRRKRKYHSHRSHEFGIVCELDDSQTDSSLVYRIYHSFVSFSLPPVRACVRRSVGLRCNPVRGTNAFKGTVYYLQLLNKNISCFLSVRRTVYTQMLLGHTTIDSFVERSIDSEPTTTRRMKERMEAAAAILIRRTTYDRSAGSHDRCRFQMVMLQQQQQQRHYDDVCRCHHRRHPYSQGIIKWKTLVVTIFLMVFLQQQQFQKDGPTTQADSHVGTWIMDFVATSSSSSSSSFTAVMALIPIRPVTTTTMTKATLRRIDFNNNNNNNQVKKCKSFSSSHVALLPRPQWMAKVLSMSKENHDDMDEDGPLFYNDFESYGDSGSDNSKRINNNANPDTNDSQNDDDDDDDIDDDDDDDDDVLASSNQDQLLGDWRSFRRKLAAQERMTETKLSTNLQQPRIVSSSTDNNSTSTTGSSPPETSQQQQQQRTTSSSTTTSTISSATIHSWSSGGGTATSTTTTSNNHKSPNEIILEQQNEKLAMEYHTDVWAHEIATVRVQHNVFLLYTCLSLFIFPTIFFLLLTCIIIITIIIILVAGNWWFNDTDAFGSRNTSKLPTFRHGEKITSSIAVACRTRKYEQQ
jgi:hypothetical protein